MEIINYIETLILLFFTYSFAGWVMESIGGIFVVKKFINRGFMIGPLCPVYGVGVVIITVLLGKYANDFVALFVLATVLCGFLEYMTSYVMEKMFNARWWDYTNRRFNINGRVCLENLCAFGIAGSVILRYINPFFISLYDKVPERIRHIITGILFFTFIIDFTISFRIIFSFKGETYVKMDNTEEISSKVKDKAEDIIMQAESDVIHSVRKIRLKRQRRTRYRRNKIFNSKTYTLRDLIDRMNDEGSLLKEKIAYEKEKIDNLIKSRKLEFEAKQKEYINNKIQKTRTDFEKIQKNSIEKINNIKMSSEEITKQIKERFGNQSKLKDRLIKAFPDMKISNSKEKSNKK
jgi:uncharacterized membrane protein